jgi:hypothetical protein
MNNKYYQDAIENNYSHEQMTPLNSISANSSYLKNKLVTIFCKE